MNYYPFHLGDYSAHTAHLEPMEDLAYRRLLDLYYLREEPLPCDHVELSRVIRMRAYQDDVLAVLKEFFTLTDDGWRHSRCDEEILRMKDKQAKARESARASVDARKAKAELLQSERSATAERTLNERSTDVELPTPTPTPTPKEGYAQADPGQPVPPKVSRKKSEPPVTDGTWKAYSGAYIAKYGAPPVRNERVNALLAKLVKRLGAEKAPAVAEFFVSKAKNDYYTARMHTVDVLLADAEKLHTEWATGRVSTTKRDIFAGSI